MLASTVPPALIAPRWIEREHGERNPQELIRRLFTDCEHELTAAERAHNARQEAIIRRALASLLGWRKAHHAYP
ncbi:hypothetical protein [Kitasatospora sp. NPDC094015]|uniref:hypothetical protein n=1 Tax=Kitasatospora sp. NPDC094015 TaxID=3155205 RepID=UPI00331B6949